MSLDAALSTAVGGLAHVQRQLAQTADNVSNAGTAGFTRKSVAGEALNAADIPFGVRSLEARRDVDAAMVAQMGSARSALAAAAAREAILRPVEQAQGDPERAESVADLTATLRNAFVSLAAAPSDQPLQQAVVAAAQDLAGRYNDVADAIGGARQAAHDGMVADVATLNAALREVASLNRRIAPLSAEGRSIAALADQRDAAVARIAAVLEVRVIPQPNDGVTLVASGGIALPLDEARDAVSLGAATIGADAYHGPGGTIPGVMLGGLDITAQLSGGRLAEYARLRDEVLPLQQAELDVSAAALASRLEAQGLRLFTDGAGDVPDLAQPYADPGSGLLGFAGSLRVNAALQADPAKVRDGTHAVTAGAGGATAFTPNPAGGPASFATLLERVTDFSFGTQVAAGVAQAGLPTAGLGPSGLLASGLGGAGTVEDYAARLVAGHTADRAAATGAKESAAAMLSGLEQRFHERSGVDVDSEMASMITLQNAYAANARVMSTVQAMYDALFAAVR
ncbi:hypothetical protein LPC08_20110 [Roseomonas sp. OT10]|uniref:flagellar hook-associated protein FlgK n=1 Tax=Roseomonas cutis TaxID=2897332 RepID=UPI001E42A86F|nr:flagellar basal body rod C-terminal domain-containing protein [Roseomonas sp. OT10]UFN48293.1 hypothetical protein LPC08_20110 [Roseomonas sp. OT10]